MQDQDPLTKPDQLDGAASKYPLEAKELLEDYPSLQSRLWTPSHRQAFGIALLGAVICLLSFYDESTGDPIFSYIGGFVGAALTTYGVLGRFLSPRRFSQLVRSVVDPSIRPTAWEFHAASFTFGVLLAAYAIVVGASETGRNAISPGAHVPLRGLLMMVVAALLIGFSVVRLVPSLED
jgi:hypothetical protein